MITESSNIWAAATNVQLTLSTCSNVLSDIKLPHLTGEFTPESNYSSGLFSFAQLTDIPLTAVGVCALESLLRVSFCCSDWFSSPLSSLAARKWGLIVFHSRGELVKYTPLSKCEETLQRKARRNLHFHFHSCRGDQRRRECGKPVFTLGWSQVDKS